MWSTLSIVLIFIGLVSVYWIAEYKVGSVYRITDIDDLVDIQMLELEDFFPSKYEGVYKLSTSLSLSLKKSEYLYTSIIGEDIELLLRMHSPDVEGDGNQIHFGMTRFSSSFYRSDPSTIHKIEFKTEGVTKDVLGTAIDCFLTRSCSLHILGSVKAKRLGIFADYYDIDATLGNHQLWMHGEDYTSTQNGITLTSIPIGDGDYMAVPTLGNGYYHRICISNDLKIDISREFPHVFTFDVVYTPKNLKLARIAIDVSKIGGMGFNGCSWELGPLIRDREYAIIDPYELAYSELDMDDGVCWSDDVELNNIVLYLVSGIYRDRLTTSDIHKSAGFLMNSNMGHPECPACPSGPPPYSLQGIEVNDILKDKSYVAKMTIC